MSDHTLRLHLNPGYSVLALHCEHEAAMPWCDHYDEHGNLILIDDKPTGYCWADLAAADAYDVAECLGDTWNGHDVDLPALVHCWWDGDGLVIDRMPEEETP